MKVFMNNGNEAWISIEAKTLVGDVFEVVKMLEG